MCLTTTYCESGDLAKIVKHASKTKSLLGEKTILGWFAQVITARTEYLHELCAYLAVNADNIMYYDGTAATPLLLP